MNVGNLVISLACFQQKTGGTLDSPPKTISTENQEKITLPETNIAPTNGWLEYDPFLLGRPIFRGLGH